MDKNEKEILKFGETKKESSKIEYTKEENDFISFIKKRLEDARTQRESPHDEFDGMTYREYYESNEKGANTYIKPKANKHDNNFQSGTIRSKIMSVLSALNNLNLSSDIIGMDEDNNEFSRLGLAIENIIHKTEEYEQDEEKKILRQYELAKQGTVFVEEIWKERIIIEKKFSKKFNGTIGIEWKERIKKDLSMPERNWISGLGVYLGNIREYFIENQPYIFTVEECSYDEAKLIFGKWERWKYVPRKIVREDSIAGDKQIVYGWQLTELETESNVEIIKYQDKFNNVYAIFINGILMTPVEMGLPWGWCGYNITQQNLSPIKMDFAYGKSMVATLKSNVEILDHLLRLAVKKTEKSINPPRANLSGRAISSKMYEAGVISNNIDPSKVPMMEKDMIQGMTNAEMMLINRLTEINDVNSVSKIFQGQSASGEQTATESVIAQRQAEQSIGIIVNMCALLEYKLTWLRLYNLLENWFDPVDKELDETREMLINKYRSISRKTPIEGEGLGRMITEVSDKEYTSKDLENMENAYSEKSGVPVRIHMINPKFIKSSRIIWQVVISSKEKKTTELGKLMFERFMVGLQPFMQDVNMQYLEDEYAEKWDINSSKLFKRGQSAIPQGAGGLQDMGNQVQEMSATGSQKNVPEVQGMTRAKI